MEKIYYQAAIQGEGFKDDGAEENPSAWSMIADTPMQLVNWLNDSANKVINEDGDVEPKNYMWFRVLNREELATWQHIREVVDLRKKLIQFTNTNDNLVKEINKLRREIKVMKKSVGEI